MRTSSKEFFKTWNPNIVENRSVEHMPFTRESSKGYESELPINNILSNKKKIIFIMIILMN